MKKQLLFLLSITILVSCARRSSSLPEFPLALHPTGIVKEGKVRVYVRDGEIKDEKTIKKFIERDWMSHGDDNIYPGGFFIEFISEGEAKTGSVGQPLLKVMKEKDLFKLYEQVRREPRPFDGSQSYSPRTAFEKIDTRVEIKGDIFSSVYDTSDNFYDNNKGDQIREHGEISLPDGSFLLPRIIARGNFNRLHVSFVRSLVSCADRNDSGIIRYWGRFRLTSNELKDMSRLQFREDYLISNGEKVRVSDTIAVQEVLVEFKEK